jgi:hypothetical protein
MPPKTRATTKRATKPKRATKAKRSTKSQKNPGGLSDRDACILWGRAGGHCSNPSCLQPITKFLRSLLIGNAGERAHIVARKADGPRGDQDRSTRLAASLNNHILLCLACHTMVDSNPTQFPKDVLHGWKRAHEDRVASLLHLGLVAAKTYAVHVRARFGAGEGRVLIADPGDMLRATLQVGHSFDDPAGHITINADTFRRDSETEYWQSAPDEMAGQFEAWARRHGGLAKIPHLSVFPSGPIPLLVVLGRLIGDTRVVDVRDFDRDTSSWLWPDKDAAPIDFHVTSTEHKGSRSDAVRLVVDLSGRTDRSAQTRALGGMELPEVLVAAPDPKPGLIRGPKILPQLRRAFQQAFELAKDLVSDTGIVHVFAAMPASAAVAFGQAQFPKAMPVMRIYDNNVSAGGWRVALSFDR